MSKILYWHVKLFQHYLASTLIAGGGINKVQVFEGYATDKPRFRPGAEFVIELFTTPSALETISIRTCSIDSMVCTPVCEEEPKSANHETPELPKQESFELITLPLIQWLNENSNPHAIIVIDPTSAALYTSETGFTTEEFLKD